MISAVMRLRSYLPEPLWRKIRDLAWRRYWRAEEARQSKSHGRPVSGLALSERGTLVERIGDHYPFASVLEIGCAYGQNFHTLAPLFPAVKMLGIDRSRDSIEGGNVVLRESGIMNAVLEVGEGENLERFANRSFDIVYCSACLLYVRANTVERVVKEMLRVARKRVLILEQHAENPSFPNQALGTFVQRPGDVQGYWIRDYRALLKRFIPEDRFTLTRVPKPSWAQEQWRDLAYLVDVQVN